MLIAEAHCRGMKSFVAAGSHLVFQLRKGEVKSGDWEQMLLSLASLTLPRELRRTAEALIRRTRELPQTEHLAVANDVLRLIRRVAGIQRRMLKAELALSPAIAKTPRQNQRAALAGSKSRELKKQAITSRSCAS